MDLDLDDDQRAVVDVFTRLFEAESTPDRVRQAEERGIDARLWDRIVEMEAPLLAVPSAVGGGGGRLLDLALVVHEQGRFLGAVPLVEAAVAARLLVALGADVGSVGVAPRTLALSPASSGVVELVPAGAVAGGVVALDGDAVVLVQDPELAREAVPRTLGGCPVAWWRVGTETEARRDVLAIGSEAIAAWEQAVVEWKVLTSTLLVGAGRAALDLAVEYVRERRQFGAPIGSFQTVAHRLADVAVELDGVGLLALEAASVLDDPFLMSTGETPTLAAMTFGAAAEAAQRAVKECLHFFGGYGFMLEYDIQLYFQRVKAWSLLAGDATREFERVGRGLLARGDVR